MEGRLILGLAEPVTLIGNNGTKKTVIARIDSGARISSIDTALAEELDLGPIMRLKVVKSASGTGKRPILTAKIELLGESIEDEFTLADRSHMTYVMLIGQNILKKGKFLIDPLKEVSE